jgi:hypothetical protein
MSNRLIPEIIRKDLEQFMTKPNPYRSLLDKWILVGHTPVEVGIEEWGRWFQDHNAERIIGSDTVGEENVSTVFLGIDHGYLTYGKDHIPVLFETMIFGGEHDQWCERWRSWDEARMGHLKTVLKLRRGTLK